MTADPNGLQLYQVDVHRLINLNTYGNWWGVYSRAKWAVMNDPALVSHRELVEAWALLNTQVNADERYRLVGYPRSPFLKTLLPQQEC